MFLFRFFINIIFSILLSVFLVGMILAVKKLPKDRGSLQFHDPIGSTLILSLSMAFIWSFTLWMFLNHIYCSEYIDSSFSGKKPDSEYYGDPSNCISDPLEWKFYDPNGKVIDSGSYREESDDCRHHDDVKEAPSSDGNHILEQEAELVELHIEVMNHRENELVFSISADDYVASYNGYYWRDNHVRFLLPSSKWKSWSEDTAIHSAHRTRYYQFTADEKIWSLPTITVYVPIDGDYIQEITLNYDWHSHTESLFKQYEQMCFYTLKVFFPELSDEEIIDLYTEIIDIGYENVFPSDAWYSSDSVPCAFYYKGGIGIYPYFAIGSSERLCIIPITEETINDFELKGVEIHEIP